MDTIVDKARQAVEFLEDSSVIQWLTLKDLVFEAHSKSALISHSVNLVDFTKCLLVMIVFENGGTSGENRRRGCEASAVYCTLLACDSSVSMAE